MNLHLPKTNAKSLALTTLLALLAIALPAFAQNAQYTAPGSLPFQEVPSKERLETAMSESRWHWGALRVNPWYGVRNMGWMDNVYNSEGDTTSDFFISAGAGIHAYTHAGPKVIIAAHILPEYVWWQELEERRTWNGRYGLGAFCYFNRLTIEATATTAMETQYLSSELEQPVNLRRDRGGATFDFKLGGHFSIIAGGELSDYRYREEDDYGPLTEQVLQLDRDESRLRAGLRYSFSRGSRLTLGVEDVSVEFQRPERDRSNSGLGPMMELTIDGKRVRMQLLLSYPDLEPTGDSEFTPFNDLLGRFQLRWTPRARLEWQLYGFRNLVYSLSENSPYYTDDRLGLAAMIPIGQRMAIRAFVESGANDYAPSLSGVSEPDTDLTSAGLQYQVKLHAKVNLRITAMRTSYDSEVASRTRDVNRIFANVALGDGVSTWW